MGGIAGSGGNDRAGREGTEPAHEAGSGRKKATCGASTPTGRGVRGGGARELSPGGPIYFHKIKAMSHVRRPEETSTAAGLLF